MRLGAHVRFVPQADIAHTPNTIRCRALADAWEQSARRHEGLTQQFVIARVAIEFNF
jgi:hypothetical protein